MNGQHKENLTYYKQRWIEKGFILYNLWLPVSNVYLVQEDQNTIKSLKKEIEKAWKMVDTAQEGEERARETIETLNTEIQNLTKVRIDKKNTCERSRSGKKKQKVKFRYKKPKVKVRNKETKGQGQVKRNWT